MKSVSQISTSLFALLFLNCLTANAQQRDPADGSPRIDPRPANAPFLPTDPLIALYRITGITDNGGAANTGVATSFHCFNGTATAQGLRFAIRGATGAVVKLTPTLTVNASATFTASTHPTVVFQDAGAASNLATGFIGQGTAIISGTDKNIWCTAMIMDAAAAKSHRRRVAYGSVQRVTRRPGIRSGRAAAAMARN